MSSKRKSCVVSRSFGKRIETFQELKEAVANYCLNASEKIRSESLVAKAITVFVRTSPFQRNFGYYSNAKTVDFPIATNNSIETVKTAVSILESIFKNGYRYQKAGVMLTGLSNASDKTNLFTSEKDEKINSLMRSIDNTNHRYGRSTLSVASLLVLLEQIRRRAIDKPDGHCGVLLVAHFGSALELEDLHELIRILQSPDFAAPATCLCPGSPHPGRCDSATAGAGTC